MLFITNFGTSCCFNFFASVCLAEWFARCFSLFWRGEFDIKFDIKFDNRTPFKSCFKHFWYLQSAFLMQATLSCFCYSFFANYIPVDTPISFFRKEKYSALKEYCSCLPRNPKYCVSYYQRVAIILLDVLSSSWPHSDSMFNTKVI